VGAPTQLGTRTEATPTPTLEQVPQYRCLQVLPLFRIYTNIVKRTAVVGILIVGYKPHIHE
jgi:hypothetical protein